MLDGREAELRSKMLSAAWHGLPCYQHLGCQQKQRKGSPSRRMLPAKERDRLCRIQRCEGTRQEHQKQQRSVVAQDGNVAAQIESGYCPDRQERAQPAEQEPEEEKKKKEWDMDCQSG